MRTSIFEATNHWRTNAIINPYGVERWVYISGFRRAAEILADSVIDTHLDQDCLVYPIMYNYRHFFELAIKDGLLMLAQLNTQEIGKREFYGHSLQRLWNDARPKIVAHFPEWDHAPLDLIDAMVGTLHSLDPNGESFRYSDRPLGITCIGIDTLRLKMTEVITVIEGINMSLSAHLDWHNEMLSNYDY